MQNTSLIFVTPVKIKFKPSFQKTANKLFITKAYYTTEKIVNNSIASKF